MQRTVTYYLQASGKLLAVTVCMLAFVVSATGVGMTLITSSNVGTRDFIDYWASARQLVEHANPYDGDGILRIEQAEGSQMPVMVMRNPPVVLPLLYPLGFMNAAVAARVWSLLLLGCLMASVRLVWVMHGRPDNHVAVLGYTSAAALSCLGAGQTSLIVLLGLVLFLRWHRSSPVAAGAALCLLGLKPHLFLPFLVALLGWAIVSRQRRLLASAACTLLLGAAAAFVLDPSGWSHYRKMMIETHIESLPIPCASLALLHLYPGSAWLQFVPSVLGCMWAAGYFYKHRGHWDWMEHGSLLVVVSLAVAPYSWFMDQVIVIPAILHAVYRSRSMTGAFCVALLNALFEIANFKGVPLTSNALYLWSASAWVVLYVWIRSRSAAEDAGDSRVAMGIGEPQLE